MNFIKSVSKINYRSSHIYALFLTSVFCLGISTATAAESVSLEDKKGGISLGGTRVIYNEKAGGASVRVINTSNVPFLVQTWVDSYKGLGGWESPTKLAQGTFVATPPLFRLDKGENNVRIQRAAGDFPKDRESVFHLNVKTIPAADKPAEGTNYIQFAFVNSVKMFWRPAGLTGNPLEAYKSLKFKRNGSNIEAINSSPYHITVKKLSIGGKEVKEPDARMVPPLSSQTWPIPDGANGNISYVVVDDHGALTPPVTVNF